MRTTEYATNTYKKLFYTFRINQIKFTYGKRKKERINFCRMLRQILPISAASTATMKITLQAMRRNLSAQTPVIVNILTLDYLHKSMISKATCYIIRLLTLLATTFTALTLPTFGLLHCYIIFYNKGENCKIKSMNNVQFSIAYGVWFEVQEYWGSQKNLSPDPDLCFWMEVNEAISSVQLNKNFCPEDLHSICVYR